MDSPGATNAEAVENPLAAPATTDTEPARNDLPQHVEDAAEPVQLNDQKSVQPDVQSRGKSDEPAPIPERRSPPASSHPHAATVVQTSSCPTCKQFSPRPPKPDPTPATTTAPAHHHALTGAAAANAPLWIRAFYNQKIKSLKIDHAKTALVAQVRRELEALYAADPGAPHPRFRLEYLGDEDRMPLDSREHWHQALDLVELRERAHLHVFCIDDPLRPPTPDEPPTVAEPPCDVEKPTLTVLAREFALAADGPTDSTRSATPNANPSRVVPQPASPSLHDVPNEPPRLVGELSTESIPVATPGSPGPSTAVASDPSCDSSDSLNADGPILLEPPDPIPPPAPGLSRSSPLRSRTAPFRPPRDWDFSTNPRDLRDPEYEARLSLINPRDPLPPPPTGPSAPVGSAPPRVRPRRASTSNSASSSTASSRSVSPARGSPVAPIPPPPSPPAPIPLKSALKKRVSFSGDAAAAAAKPFDRVPPLPQTRRINRISEEDDDGDEVDGGADDAGEGLRGRSMSFPPPPPVELPPVIGRSRSTSPDGLPRPPRWPSASPGILPPSTPTTVMVPVLVPYVLVPAAALALQAPPMPLPPITASGPAASVEYLPMHSSEQIGAGALSAREDLPPRPRSMVDYHAGGGGGAGGAAARAAALPRRPHTTHAPPSYYRQYIEKQK
ncbi:hypothetical protein AMAG_09533 [Allomyces macrogynus ATCC 38327]|uniref:Uncharacterized protein n=1 Tax=Allomyces macrogynus (strain ATCC 38327) TaxID=578462 RepID=A0A0L0SPR7_ALLM3|nr:hypothetical protein AMAG_09533 [Allomyces macrogynus ATCC 38327]|eukprot:KNE64518.1 hypothetical protein AMAG_09533 [Allomyces macrogynus ATCC 38327]